MDDYIDFVVEDCYFCIKLIEKYLWKYLINFLDL